MTFDDFWQAWPADHRVGKKQAVDQWARLTEADREMAVEDVQWRTAHRTEWQAVAKDGRWAIPHPFRYLRDRRFEDVRAAANVIPRASVTPEFSHWCQHEPRCGTYEYHDWRLAKEAQS